LAHPWVKEGIFYAGFVDEEFIPSVRPSPDLARLFVSIGSALAPEAAAAGAEKLPEGALVKWAVGDQLASPDPTLLNWIGEPEHWSVKKEGRDLPGVSGKLRVADGRVLRACAYPISAGKWRVRVGLWTLQVRRIVQVPGKPQNRKILSLVPGRVHSVLFREGAQIPAHEPILIVESLRMLVPHALPVGVKLRQWNVKRGDQVHSGQELAEFEIPPKA
jgi:hypothetical protein